MQQELLNLVEKAHKKHWIEPEKNDKRETLGCVVASFCNFSPEDIVVAFLAALEDANAHAQHNFLTQYFLNEGYSLASNPAHEFLKNDEE